MAKSNTIQHLKSRVSKLELERTQLQNNVYDAEEALKMAAKDKEYLGIYIRSLTTAFDKVGGKLKNVFYRNNELSNDLFIDIYYQCVKMFILHTQKYLF